MWRKLGKRISLLSILASLASCSGGFGTMDRIMQSWSGAPMDEVVSQWGYPDAQQAFMGKTIYHWDRTVAMNMPASTTGTINVIGNTAYLNTTTSGGGVMRGACRRSLEVNSKNIVVGSQWKGNNCPFADVAMGYQHWERKQ